MKLTNIVWLVVGLEILLYVSGVNETIGTVLRDMGIDNPILMATHFIFTEAKVILLAGGVATIIIGLWSKIKTENALMAGVALFFLDFMADIIGIISIANATCPAFGLAPNVLPADCAWTTWIVVALMVPLAVVFVMAVLDWWRGRDG
jgi:hypothetical protein